MKLSREERRKAEALIVAKNKTFPNHLIKLTDKKSLENRPPKCTSVWRSCNFLAQVYKDETPGITRITINRTTGKVKEDGTVQYDENITWEELQRLKHECGYGDFDAVEVYPRDQDVVNVANMRHLFVFDQLLSFTWRKN